MNILLRSIGLLLAWAMLLRPGSAQAQDAGGAFSCDGTFYQVRQSGTGTTAFSVLYKVDRTTTPYATNPIMGGTFGTTGKLNVSGNSIVVNGLAYNSQDGYLYALTYPADNAATTTIAHLYKIGLGGVQDLGATNLPNTGQFATGSFDKTGHYYVTTRNSTTNAFRGNLYRFDLNSSNNAPLNAATVLMKNNTGGTVTSTTTEDYFDIAYNPSDNKLYGVFADNILYRLDLYDGANNATTGNTSSAAPAVTAPTTARITQLGTTAGTQAIGTAFFDVAGNLFAYSNGAAGVANGGTFYKVNIITGAYTQLSAIDGVSNSDGASCINPNQRIDVTKELTNVVAVNATTFNVTYTIRVRNTGTVTDDYVQVSDLLSGSGATTANTTFPTAVSTTIIAAPVVTNLDGATLAANPSFTGKNGNASLLNGTQGLTAGQRAIITYTVQVVFAAGQVPAATTAQNNTAYATSAGTSPNNGYTQLAADGSLLPPSTLEANDASTVSSTFPNLRADLNDQGDTPAPTPLFFAPSISGTVFEDVNYGGGAGRSQSASTGVGRGGATVELYTGTGASATYKATTTTAADGSYSFTTGLTAGTSYTVRVVNSTVTSSRPGAVTGLLPVQTYRTQVTTAAGTTPDANRVGGEDPARTDAAAGTTGSTFTTLTAPSVVGVSVGAIPESQAPVTFSTVGSPAVNVNFGYNFDAVVNTNDAGQGSLRQFILNSNALGGEASLAQSGTTTAATAAATSTSLPAGVETSIFMIPDGAAHPGLLARANGGPASQFATTTSTSTAATILLTSAALPAITGQFTALDGGTQTSATGNSNEYSLATTNAETTGPEVIIDLGYRAGTPAAAGFGPVPVAANDVRLLNLGIINSITGDKGIRIKGGALRTLVTNNTVNNNDGGISFDGSQTANASVITYNVIRNARGANNDGIELNGGNNNLTISYNQILRNAGNGIDYVNGSSGSNTITYNNFSGNGTAGGAQAQLSGVALRSSNSNNNTISYNTFTNNSGSGIIVVGGSTGNTFSQNSFSANGINTTGTGTAYTAPTGQGLAIDLTATTDKNIGANGDGVTLNATGTRAGGNNLLNFPVLTTATVNADNLVVNGYARPGNLVELYLAAPDPTGFGEGATYLTNFTQGTAVGTAGNVVTGSAATYGPAAINGLNQGTDNTNTFTATIPLSSLTAAQATALRSGAAVLTSTATMSGTGTSEFSGNLNLLVADVTVSLTGPTTLSTGQATGTYAATFTNEGPGAAADVARTVTLPTGASLSLVQRQDLVARYAATFTTTGSGATAITTINFGTVALAGNASSLVTFAFTAPNAVSPTLALTANTTSASQGANVAPDQVTLALSTVATADVRVTSLTPSATTTTGKFAVVFGNNGPQTAAGVTYSVQLPAGLTGVVATNGGSYDGATGLVAYGGAATTLASGGQFASDITYPLASAPNVPPVTATARVSTTTDEAGLTANNAASTTAPIRFDLTTTLSGPAAAVAGSPTTLYVTTTNNGPNPAGNATQTVSIPSAATLAGSIYLTNGGTYSFSGGVGTVTFPTLPNLPGGQTVTNSISFLAPAANFAPSAVVTTTAITETNTANNVAYLNGAAASTSVTVSSVAAFSNEATTIEATVTAGGMTTPATVVDVATPITYVVKSFNQGYQAATAPATVVEQVQLLPGLTAATLKVGSATPTTLANGNLSFANAAGTTTYNPASGLLTYYTVTQAAGESTTYDAITVTAPAAVGNGGQLLATASVQTTNFVDPVPADNVASVAVRVRTKPDLTTSVSGPSSTIAGLPATYAVRFTNSGTNDAATVTETAQLPAGLSSVTVTYTDSTAVTGVTYDSGTGLLTFPGLIANVVGTSLTYIVRLTAPAQNFPVTSTIAGVTSDGVATNNSATQLTTVTANADLAVGITGPATAVIGNPITYVVTTTNNGPSMATGVTPTLQLPRNLTNVEVSSSANYNAATGLLTFAAKGSLTPGGSTTNYVTFTMPDATAANDAAVSNGLIIATAAVTSSSADQVAANNTAALTTSVSPATPEVADLLTSLSRPTGSATTVPAGTLLTYTVAYRNAGSSPAVNAVGTVNLPTGLLATDLTLNGTGSTPGTGVKGTQTGSIITFGGTTNGLPAGTTYNQTTGLLTFPTFATLPVSTASDAYSISFTAPPNDVQAISEITSVTTDNGPGVNRSLVFTTISANVDVATALNGPATAQPGTTVTYGVTTVNNGPSQNPNSTFQTVTLPAGVAPVAGSYGNGTYSSANNTITWTIPFGQAPGTANAVVNTFSLVMPATGNVNLSASLTSAGENTTNPITGASNGPNNSATLTTIPANQAPVAENIWNTLRGARANDALALPISPLLATDADGSIDSYVVTTAPAPSQGTLYYNGSAVTNNTTVAANGLSFVPTPGFVGNATFSYVATDNGGAVSPPALYTIPVAKDQELTYAATPAKGGAVVYSTNDVLAYAIDPNTATYTSAGLVYSATGGKLTTILLAGAANGLLLTGTNAVLTAGSGPAASGSYPANAANTLPAGVSLDPATGLIYVSGTLTNSSTQQYYQVYVTTTDANGGITKALAQFTIGANPLPVVLTVFTAQAAHNRDAQLSWNTASEVNSASFEVERSLDGAAYAKIGEVAAQGTTPTAHAYAFTDAGIAARAQGPVYYRLRQVDLDGTATYSPVRTVRFTKAATLALGLYPNPATASTNLDLSALPVTGSYQVLVLDATGRQVLAATLGGGLPQPLQVAGLASGTYQVLVTGTLANGAALRQVLRLIKE